VRDPTRTRRPLGSLSSIIIVVIGRPDCSDRQPRHRFLEPIHNVKDGSSRSLAAASRGSGFFIPGKSLPPLLPKRRRWWSQPGSNRRPQACKASALPTELWPQHQVRMFTNVRTDEQGPTLKWWAEKELNLRPH